MLNTVTLGLIDVFESMHTDKIQTSIVMLAIFQTKHDMELMPWQQHVIKILCRAEKSFNVL